MANGLRGKRVLVTRAAGQNANFSAQLADAGAVPVEFPTIRIVPPVDAAPLRAAIATLNSFDWVVLTSVNGVRFFRDALTAAGKSVEDLNTRKIAVVGPATAAELEKFGARIDHIPPKHVAESLAETLPVSAGERVLYPTANIARDALERGLRQRGVQVTRVTAYRTEAVTDPQNLPELLPTVDMLTFTSASTVRNFAALLPPVPPAAAIGDAVVACIGPIAADAARSVGLPVHIVPEKYTIAGLVAAMKSYLAGEKVSG